jgi:hypothetical protein
MRQRLSDLEVQRLAKDLASLPELSGENLNDRFRHLCGLEPPRRMRRPLLIRFIAYRLQEQALGGLKPVTRRLLASMAGAGTRHSPARAAPLRKLKPGTTVLREWHGVHHQLSVLEDGVRFAGEHYRSLSEVARKITGSRWSGPLFFGLKTAAAKEHHDGAE